MDLQEIEVSLLLEGIAQYYGYDFRQYTPASLRRRLQKCLHDERLATLSGLQERVLHDPAAMQRLLLALSVSTSSMYRDPGFYRSFRTLAVPLLRTYPFFRIWHAGCAEGQEVLSLAILLEEEELYGRSRVYATDINESLLALARTGAYPLRVMQEYTRNYVAAGGPRSFSEYYKVNADKAAFDRALQRNTVWAQHNLVTDGVFNTFQVVLCRNVLIYFSRPLQERVHRLIYDSLEPFGILVLGNRESLQLTPYEGCYEALDVQARLYRKVR